MAQVRRSFPIIEPGFARTAWGAGLASELAYGADGRTLTAWTSGVSAADPDVTVQPPEKAGHLDHLETGLPRRFFPGGIDTRISA
jgi:hypothetical protein